MTASFVRRANTEVSDFQDTPFDQQGGLRRTHDLFYQVLPGMFEEFNVELVRSDSLKCPKCGMQSDRLKGMAGGGYGPEAATGSSTIRRSREL